MDWYKIDKDRCYVMVRVSPGSSRTSVDGVKNGVLRIKLQAPPVDGAANEALIILLSKEFKVAKSTITILSGHHAKIKRILVPFTSQVEQKLKEWNIKVL